MRKFPGAAWISLHCEPPLTVSTLLKIFLSRVSRQQTEILLAKEALGLTKTVPPTAVYPGLSKEFTVWVHYPFVR